MASATKRQHHHKLAANAVSMKPRKAQIKTSLCSQCPARISAKVGQRLEHGQECAKMREFGMGHRIGKRPKRAII